MTVLEQAEVGYGSTLLGSLARAVGGFALTGVIVAPLFMGAVLGYVVTERLDDPEASAIKANLPEVGAGTTHRFPTGVDG